VDEDTLTSSRLSLHQANGVPGKVDESPGQHVISSHEFDWSSGVPAIVSLSLNE